MKFPTKKVSTKPKQNKLFQVLSILGRKVFLPTLVVFLAAETGVEVEVIKQLISVSED